VVAAAIEAVEGIDDFLSQRRILLDQAREKLRVHAEAGWHHYLRLPNHRRILAQPGEAVKCTKTRERGSGKEELGV
jgi:hypothetical protein